MKKLILVFAALIITSSPGHAQVYINGGADVGASYIVHPDRVTSEQMDEFTYKLTPNLLNYPVTKWCVSEDGTTFRTLGKVRVCLRVPASERSPQGISCRVARLTLDAKRSIPLFTLSADGILAVSGWTAAPSSFEILTVDAVVQEDTIDRILERELYDVQKCK